MLRFILILLVLAISGVTYFYISENEKRPPRKIPSEQTDNSIKKKEEYVFYKLKNPTGKGFDSIVSNAPNTEKPKTQLCQSDMDCKRTNQHIIDTKSSTSIETNESKEKKSDDELPSTSDMLNNDSIEKLIKEKEKKDEILNLIDGLDATQKSLDSN